MPPSPTTTPVSKIHQSYQVNMQPGYPETLYLDHSRLLLLTADAADITATAMFLAVYRQLVFTASAKSGKRAGTAPVSDERLTELKHEIAAVGASRPGLCFCKDYALEKMRAHESAQVVHWRNDMHATALHLAHAVELAGKENLGEAMDEDDASARFKPPSAELLESVTNWSATHMRPETAVSSVFRKKIATALLKQLIPRFFALWGSGSQQRGSNASLFTSESLESEVEASGQETPKTKSGLEPLDEEIKLLAERLAKLAVLHLRVFLPFYEMNSSLHSALPASD